MSNQIELRHIRYFLAVADTLHFGRAAADLFISQPGLSRQIKQLEEVLGYELFKRDNRNVELTAAGKYLQEELRLLSKNLEQALEHGRLVSEGIAGILRFGYLGSAMQNIIPDLLLKFRSVHPNIRFSFQEMENREQVDRLRSGDLDIGFVRLGRVPEELAVRPVLEDTFSLVLPSDHPLNSARREDLLALRSESFILFERSYSPAYYEQIMQIFDGIGFHPEISHHTVHAGTIYKLVENKFGISIVPTSLTHGYDMGVKFLEMGHLPQRTTLSAIWNKQNRNPILGRLVGML